MTPSRLTPSGRGQPTSYCNFRAFGKRTEVGHSQPGAVMVIGGSRSAVLSAPTSRSRCSSGQASRDPRTLPTWANSPFDALSPQYSGSYHVVVFLTLRTCTRPVLRWWRVEGRWAAPSTGGSPRHPVSQLHHASLQLNASRISSNAGALGWEFGDGHQRCALGASALGPLLVLIKATASIRIHKAAYKSMLRASSSRVLPPWRIHL